MVEQAEQVNSGSGEAPTQAPAETTPEQINTAVEADAAESSGEEVTMEEYLLYSARYGEIEGMQEAINERVNIDYQNEDIGNAALHLASANGHIPAVTFLLENGANLNLQNKSKNTALHWACLCGQIETVKVLCEWFEKNPDRP